MIAIRDLEQTKERLLSFAEYAKDAQPEILVTLIQTIVERIYIVDKDDERFCHIFIKGCTGEDYTGFFQTASYIESENASYSAPMCDSEQYCICTKIPETSNLQRHKSRCGSDTGNIMQEKRDRNNRSRMYARSCTHASKDSTKIFGVRNSGVSEREKFTNDIRKTCKFEIQVWKSSFLVSGLFCRHSREKHSCNKGAYPKSDQRGFGI